MPRPKPPYPAQEGLWGKPTVINNVETYANIPPIILQGQIGSGLLEQRIAKVQKSFCSGWRYK